uniref:Uncharacterized protein n=1 Tax=Lepeophtheirus salmonis TaxID=72036 RepID=A0A0K2VI00_LEPSM
MRKLETTLFR